MNDVDSNSEQPTSRIVELSSENATRLAELVAILHDLRFIVDCCNRLMVQLSLPPERRDSWVLEAGWPSALIAYRRVFANEIRSGLKLADVEALGLQGQILEFHQSVRDLRDAQITHSANPFETVRIGAVLGPETPDGARKINGVASLIGKHHAVEEVGVLQLGALANALALAVSRQCDEQQEIVRAEAERDVDALYDRPAVTLARPTPPIS